MFLTRIRASADRSPYGNFFFEPVGRRSASGALVTPDGAMGLPTVFACVRNISEDFAKLPMRVYRPRVGGGRVEVKDHWLCRLLSRKPNRWQTPFEWREMMEGHLLLRGNAFNLIQEDGNGGIAQLLPQHPDRVKIQLLESGNFRYQITDQFGNVAYYRPDQVWQIRGLSPDGYVGYSPIMLQRAALGVGLSAQEYAARFFANDAKPSGGWIEFPGNFADVNAKRTFMESWQQVQGGANRGKVAVLDRGMKYHEIGLNNKDSQFIETRAASAVEVCSIFRMPPHKVGILDKATFSNIEQQNIEYATDNIQSWCERWESSIECNLLGEDTDLEVEFDLRSLMRGDSASRATRAATLVNCGVLTRNEARDDEGLNPIDGLDEPLRPLNMVEEGDEEAGEAPGAEPAEPAPPANEPADASRRLQAVLHGNAERLARRLAGGGVASAQVIAEALAVPLSAAATWLQSASQLNSEPEIKASLLTLGAQP